MAKLKDLLSELSQENLTTSLAEEGAVFRMHLTDEEGVIGKNPGDDGRNKYFVVLGHDLQGNAIGFVLIDTTINPNLPQCRKDAHYKIDSATYSFLEGEDRYVDCSDFKIISKERFSILFDKHTAKGKIICEDLENIKKLTVGYVNASPKTMKRFGLM